MIKSFNLFLALIFTFLCLNSNAQVFLQLEKVNQPIPIKFQVGDVVHFKLSYDAEEWRKERIKSIMFEENVLLFDDEMVSLNDITAFRLHNTPIRIFSGMLTGFGLSWMGFGVLGYALDGWQPNNIDFIVGPASLISGFLINKFFYKKTYKMGKTANLRIVDLRFKI